MRKLKTFGTVIKPDSDYPNMHENRHWILISPSDLSLIDFTEVCETSIDTARTNIAGDKAFVKWDGSSMPASVAAINHLSDIMDHDEIKSKLSDGWFTDTKNE